MQTILNVGLADTCDNGKISMSRNYVEAVRRGGHTAVILPYSDNDDVCRQMLSAVDVLLLTGGGDMAAWRFGCEPSPYDSAENADRDAYELRLMRLAVEMQKPIAGICRGMQVINVALGGTLWQDLSYKRKGEDFLYVEHQCPEQKWEGVHRVSIDTKSRLYDAIGCETVMVNSTHHQAVKELGKDLRVVAESEDHVIEAFESTKLPIAAVQWHPERLVGEPFDRLFRDIKKWTGGC